MALTIGPVKFKTNGRYLIPGSIEREGKRLFINFKYHAWLKDEIKIMEGAKWHGYDEPHPRKIWSVLDCPRNEFQLEYLTGGNPYAPYDGPLPDWKSNRPLFKHQEVLSSHFFHRRQCIGAAQMGLGKTLAAFEAIEHARRIDLRYSDVFWIGPKSALAAVQREAKKWKTPLLPRYYTYEGLVKEVENWIPGTPAPKVIVFDECHLIKNPTAQRSKAAMHIANSMRVEWGRECMILLMSGTPAPKDPTNWWHIAEVACPGFIREGTLMKFKQRLGLLIQKAGFDGGSYPHLETWWDDDKKCAICGKFTDHENHDNINMVESWYHQYQPSTNEVSLLYRRMSGLVLVQFKKDCLPDLPEKMYEIIQLPISPSVQRAAQLVQAVSETTIKALTLLRELSDGFQYKDIENGVEVCAVCKGDLVTDDYFDTADPDTLLSGEEVEKRRRFDEEKQEFKTETFDLGIRKVPCTKCGQKGTTPTYTRTTVEVECPKEDALIDWLEQCEEEGRILVWAGFTGSIDRCTKICIKRGWKVIRVDGRGWWSDIDFGKLSIDQMLEIFDNGKETYPKVAFVGQPGSGGMGLNLTAASVAVYYSNTFKFEERAQSEDRIHRPGADINRGCRIIDLSHLPSDLMVINNLQKKNDLQNMSMGLLRETLRTLDISVERTN